MDDMELVGAVEELAAQRDEKSLKLFPDQLEMPFVMDVHLRAGAVYKEDEREVSHLVRDGSVWGFPDGPRAGHAAVTQEVHGTWPPVDTYAGDQSMRAFSATVSVRMRVDAMAWALAEAGCSCVRRVWRLGPTMLKVDGGDNAVFAEVAVLGLAEPFEKIFFTRPEAADYLGVSKHVLNQLIKAGLIRPLSLSSRKILIHRSELNSIGERAEEVENEG